MSYHRSQPSYPEFPDFPEQPGQPHPSQRPAQPAADRRRDVRALSTAYKRLRRVATLSALGYFVVFLVLCAYAPDLMSSRVTGGLTTGLLLGLLQLPVTALAVAWYERTARRRVDPLTEAVRRNTAPSPQGARR
ncbi:DUF485 domain-containing protein [Streptomyces sp. NPDC006475]|uniref:DUF485 domain-containing protein n=1 Tax=Streptomyces achmelvichensis TaxID=3134111 RepID=A0ACC6Q6I8_9ACTN|nr:DUF485 domain-containing protein [Streptomyces sp. NBC_01167]